MRLHSIGFFMCVFSKPWTCWLCFVVNMIVLTFMLGCVGVVYSIPPGHLKPMGLHIQPQGSIDSVSGFLDPREFYDKYASVGKPLLFKGAAKDIPAYNRWTDKYLASTYGRVAVDVEIGKKETRQADLERLPLAQFIYSYTTEDIYMVQDVVSVMKGDLSVPKSLLCGGFQKILEAAVIWFSSGGTKSVVHYDAVDNINCLLDGEKSLIMFDKKYADEMESSGFISDGGYSKVDVDKVDMEKYPQFSNIPWWSAKMEKGDCLFIPYRWYHTVESAPSRNLAVNLWFAHLLWFNQTDCDRMREPLPEVDSLLHHTIAGLGEEPSVEKMRADIFEPFEGRVYVTQDIAIEEWEVSGEEVAEVFDFVDTNKDMLLEWPEMYSVDVMSLVQDFPFVLPGYMEELARMEKEGHLESERDEL